ncbi:unnamed protein product [Adineta steineri]|uniref:Pectate lyase superfamily protein domain-containing protein n=1 Tax=Adineta steineri TaxID=433720 RepID=A0A814ABN3_9BILA|nr:unnamed protein product [Adineta steineri]
MTCLSIQGEKFFVVEFGAYSNDNIDDTQSIQAAIDKGINYGSGSIIIFGHGIYNLSSTISITNASNLTIIGQGISETLLLGTTRMFIFFAQYCDGLKIASLSIDFDPYPFTAGYVVNATNTYLDIRVQSPHRADIDQRVLGLIRYDPIEMRPAFGPNTYNFYQVPPNYANTSLIRTNILRIPLASLTGLNIGDAVVAVYDIAVHAIYIHDSIDVTIQSINVHSAWGMVLIANRVRRLTVSDYHVTPMNGRWLSANSDCMHFMDTREYISLSDSKCQMQGDDGLNVLTPYVIVTDIINSSTIIIQAFNWTDPLNIEDGTQLEFASSKQPFTAYTRGKVASSTVYTSTSRLFKFTTSINVSIGDLAYVGDTPSLTIRNFTVERNRARGVLLETRNVTISQSIFNKTSGPAILFQPSLYWHEGPPGRNITLTENLYINCNEGIGQQEGFITILPDPTQLIPVINDIRIESSTFYFGNFSRGLIQATNANNIYITGNYIATNISTPLITICNSRNITANNNTVIDLKAKIDQYYTFDTTDPCHVNLSSLIDLPPSAFNSSFPPPVILT